MLKLVIGAAGSGKTTYARELAGRIATQGGHPVLIVPEQFSFESERAVLELLGPMRARDVEVFSFTRLAEYLQSGLQGKRRIDDCGRVAAMGLVLNRLDYRLEYYHSKGRQSGRFIAHLLDAVKEFKLCAVTPEQLAQASLHAKGTLKTKLSELALIYGAYEATVAQTSLDPMDSLTALYDHLAHDRFFEGRTVIVDSFRSFTGQEYAVLSRIMAQAELCVITLCAERGSDEDDRSGLFATSLAAMRRLRSLAEKQGVRVAAIETLPSGRRFKSAAISAVERGVFRYGEEREVCTDDADTITIYNASGRYDELEYCARECRRLVREEGFRCRDIAVIARNEGAYAAIAADAFEQQGLPFFCDMRTNAASSALMRFVRSALDFAVAGWSSEHILRWIKTGLLRDIDILTAAELENYCYIWGIDGNSWLADFTANPAGMEARVDESQQEKLCRINAARAVAVKLLGDFRDDLRCEQGDKMAAALWRLLERSGAGERLEQLRAQMSPAQSSQQPQLWNALVGILDQLACVLGSEKTSIKDFAAYVTLMIDRCDIGSIPHGLDEITFGGADRIRVSSPRTVFIVGAADGELPKIPEGSGVFTDDERRRLRQDLELPVAEPLEEQYLEERLLAYSALASGSERLYITSPAAADGIGREQLKQSEFIDEILSCVDGANVLCSDGQLNIDKIEAPAAAFELAARHWQEQTGLEASLRACLMEKGDYSGKAQAVDQLAADAPPTLTSSEAAARTFGDKIRISPSQLESFYSCRFGYFCRYGLNLKPLRRAQADNQALGSAAHYVLEQLFAARDGQPAAIASVESEDDLTARISRLIDEYIDQRLGGTDALPLSQLYALREMSHGLTVVAINISQELAVSDFRPIAFELPVNEKQAVILPDGSAIEITGKVDRVDCYEHNGKRWLRVIDYKLKGKDFLLSDVLDGLNVQMLIYLDQLCRTGNEDSDGALPAGVVYGAASSGTITLSKGTDQNSVDAARSKDLRRSCIIIDDAETAQIADAMENGLSGQFIPVSWSAKHTLKSSDKYLISAAQYDIVRQYIRELLRDMGSGLREGSIAPFPIGGKALPCGYCDYADICRYTGDTRKKTKANNAQSIELMKKALGIEEDDGQDG